MKAKYMVQKSWSGKHILILGAARQGLALARFLARQGAVITLNDHASPNSEAMQIAVRSLASQTKGCAGKINWILGEHPLSLLDGIDLLCISGGVSLTMPIVLEAKNRKIPFSNDTQIFMECVSCPVVGITGSAGKTTTTSLTGLLFEALKEYIQVDHLWVGGNIGFPLIDHVEKIRAHDLVILEMSSFQLELMTISPQISVILNITPNHLDRHGTIKAYTEAKARILTYQKPDDVAILCRDDAGSWNLASRVNGSLESFGTQPLQGLWRGTYIEKDALFLHNDSKKQLLMPIHDIKLRGKHNLLNTLAACTIVNSIFHMKNASLEIEMIKKINNIINNFNGVPHRLEFVKSHNGIHWYNDSIATTPERTIAAINSFNEPLVLLLGGHDKNLPWQDLAKLITQRVDHLIVFGECAGIILDQMDQVIKAADRSRTPQPNQRPFSISRCSGLEEAVYTAANIARQGDVILLSPGAASYDEFIDFEERGEHFREWVKRLAI